MLASYDVQKEEEVRERTQQPWHNRTRRFQTLAVIIESDITIKGRKLQCPVCDGHDLC